MAYRWGRWLERNLTVDRWLSIIGIGATAALGAIGMTVAIAQSFYIFVVVLIAAVVLTLIAGLTLRVALHSRRTESVGLHPFPYRIEETNITVDIIADDGGLAVIRNHERVIGLQDHLIALRRNYWGDWDEPTINDLRCFAPPGAVVVDCFRADYYSMFLISLRRMFNYGDKFDHIVEFTVRNGFTRDHEEYFSWRVTPQIGRLTISLVLPPGKRLKPDSVRRRVGIDSYYDEYQVAAHAFSLSEDGRQKVTWTWDAPQRGWTYGLIWGWERVPAQ